MNNKTMATANNDDQATEIVYEKIIYNDGDILEAEHMNRIETYIEDIYNKYSNNVVDKQYVDDAVINKMDKFGEVRKTNYDNQQLTWIDLNGDLNISRTGTDTQIELNSSTIILSGEFIEMYGDAILFNTITEDSADNTIVTKGYVDSKITETIQKEIGMLNIQLENCLEGEQ